jgi:uncharacterized membrane protein YdjX (TVP38/TMEM64 family)
MITGESPATSPGEAEKSQTDTNEALGTNSLVTATWRGCAQHLRTGICVALVTAPGLFFVFGLQHQLTLAALKMRQQELIAIYEHRPVFMIGVFFLTSVALAALSIPGSVLIMAAAAGAIFGLWVGTAIQSLALATGATIAFVASRHLLHDWIDPRLPPHLESRQSASEPTLVLLSLRLIPALPFFLINMAMGLTPIRLGAFFLATQLGIVPSTMIYVNAGRQLGTIHSVADVLSWTTIGALALLAALPLAGKLVASARRKSPR